MSNNLPPSSSQPSGRRPSSGRAYDQFQDSDYRSLSRKPQGGRAPAPAGRSTSARPPAERSASGRSSSARPSAERSASGRSSSGRDSAGRSASGRSSSERGVATRPPSEARSGNSGARRSAPKQRSGRPPARRRRKPLLLPFLLLLASAILLAIVLRTFVFNGEPKDPGNYALEFSSQTLLLGESATAKVSGLPEDFNGTITWSSSDSEIVKVNNGTLTAKKVGTATISASVNSKNISGSVKVIETVEGVQSLTLNQSSVAIFSGQTVQLTYSVVFEDKDAPAVSPIWSSSNSAVASVSNDGLVTARDVGSTSITATVGNQSATCSLTVQKNPNSEPVSSPEGSDPDASPQSGTAAPGDASAGSTKKPAADGSSTSKPVAKSLAISQKLGYLSVGETLVLEAGVSPSGTAITWSSSNAAIAGVSGGLVTSKATGTAVITASAGGLTASCTIEVAPADDASPADGAPE